MPDILYGRGAYRRDNGQFPEFTVVNMFVEQTPAADEGASLLSFPGLIATATRGAGPISGIYQRAGLFGGDTFVVSGNVLYRGATSLGAITGTGPVSWASSDIEVVVTRGGTAYSYNGTNLAAVVLPDTFQATAVTFIGGLFVYARAGSGKYYWSAVLNGRTVDALDFATAESAPDRLRDVVAVGDNLFLLGEDSIEVWYITGELDLPFSRISQRTVRIGVAATGCAVEMDNALHFIGANKIVYRFGDVPERISDHGIEERLAQSASYSAFTYSWQGHTFFCVRLSQGTWCVDAATRQWHERQTWGMGNWIVTSAVTIDGTPYFGSSIGDDVLAYSGWDEGAAILLREFSAYFPIKGGSVPVDAIEVEANAGSAVGTGIDANPRLEMALSRDGGDTWSNWRSGAMGTAGQYRKRPTFRRCGYFDAPGALFKFRCLEAAPLRVSAVRVNEPASGRSR